MARAVDDKTINVVPGTPPISTIITLTFRQKHPEIAYRKPSVWYSLVLHVVFHVTVYILG